VLKALKTAKLSDETHRRVLKVVGALQARDGERKTVEAAIQYLLDENDRNREPKAKEKKKP
jgi:hypothetical protein